MLSFFAVVTCSVYLNDIAAWAASLVFLAAYVPLMTKFLPYLLGGQAAIEDIYGEKQL